MNEWLDVDTLFDYMCNCFLSYEAVGEQMKQCTAKMGFATEDLMVDGDDED